MVDSNALAELLARGWQLVPIRAGQKAPTDSNWPTTVYELGDFRAGDNVGVKCGQSSNWLVDTDCDCPEAVQAAAVLMPETALVHGRASRRRSHLWYQVEKAETKKFTGIDGKMLIEIRSTGAQTVVPPSVHPTGEAIEWENDGAPLPMDLDDYVRAVQMTAIAAMFGRHWPKQGGRHEVAGHLAGFLCRLGFTPIEVSQIVGVAARVGGDDDSEDRERIARDTARKHENGGKTTGAPLLVEAFADGKSLVSKVYHWMGRRGDEFLDALNKRHFVAELGTDMVVGTDDDPEEGVRFQSFDKFKQRYYAQRVGKVRLAEWWLSNPQQRTFRRVVFKPPPLVAHAEDYNLWRGFTITPDARERPEERCPRFLDHLANVMCGSNIDYYHYLLDVFAITVQKPGVPSGVAVAWRGDQGAGKGTVMELFGGLFGRHYSHLSSPDQLTGAFNEHLSGKVVVFADEAIWGGNKAHAGELKRLVTERTISVHRKYIARVEEPNCIHLFLATNEDWMWPTTIKERRGFILDVALGPTQTPQYFHNIREEWATGGAEAFLAYCQQREIPTGRLGPIPRTEALHDQFVLSMGFVQQWWLQKLTSGEFVRGDGWPEFLAGDTLYADYLTTIGDVGWSKRKTEWQIVAEWKKFLPTDLTVVKRRCNVNVALPGEKQPRWEKKPRNGWLLPSLDVCRQLFDKYTGIPRRWPAPLSEREATQAPLPDTQETFDESFA